MNLSFPSLHLDTNSLLYDLQLSSGFILRTENPFRPFTLLSPLLCLALPRHCVRLRCVLHHIYLFAEIAARHRHIRWNPLREQLPLVAFCAGRASILQTSLG